MDAPLVVVVLAQAPFRKENFNIVNFIKPIMKTESAVKERYAAGAQAQEAALCCPVDYDPQYLKAIPAEVIERDYGCGDPSKYVKPGETVLDLGSGTGKICFIASQVVGPEGKVIGVDMTDDLSLIHI